MRLVTAVLVSAFALLSAVSARADRLVVVELFTSQGCSSCPPADALLGELTERDEVLPLALHVDYWDYIGWKDKFADPEHTERQKGYARVAGSRSIYTPQMIVGGKDHVVGYKPMKLAMLIDRHGETPEPVDVEATRNGQTITVKLRAESPLPGRYDVVLVRYLPEESVNIRRGENAGRTLSYHNIVTEMKTLDDWNGRGTETYSARVTGEGRFAVLVQREDHGPIVAAARVN